MQALQKSDSGWDLAAHLIQTDSPNCQFFGALTYTVKINNYDRAKVIVPDTDSPSIEQPPSQKPPEHILNELLGALIFLNSKPATQLHVLRKILSTLARFFTKFPSAWPSCIYSIIATIATNEPQPHPTHSIEELCRNLNEKNTILCLEFCQVLIEDVKNTTLENAEEARIDKILNDNIGHLTALLQYASEMLYPQVGNTSILVHVFKAYSAWALNHAMPSEYIANLHPVTKFIFDYIEHHPGTELYQLGLDGVSDILNRYPSFYDKDTKTYFARILGETGRPMIEHIESKIRAIRESDKPYIYDEDEDGIEDLQENAQSFSKSAITIFELAMANLDALKSPEISTLVEYLLVISDFPGFPYVDHNLTMFLLEFWGSYAEAFLDMDDSAVFADASPYIFRVIEIFWNKLMLPVPAQQAYWKRDSWEAFDSFRKDFWEFLDSAFVIVGSPLFKTLVSSILDQLSAPTPNWEKLEASLSCINALSDSVAQEYELVAQLLQSSLLERLAQLDNMHIRTTGVNFIGSYDSFFEEEGGKPFLFPALDYLFKSLSISTLSNTASRSIQKLCSSCRTFLSSALSSFFDTYVNMNPYAVLSNPSHERTVLAICYVVQAVDDLDAKGNYINHLLGLLLDQLEKVNDEYERAKTTAEGGEEQFKRIVSLLRCLSNIGKGLQVPEEVPDQSPDQVAAMTQYWADDKFGIRSRLLQVMRVFSIDREDFKSSVDVCECSCAILKSGFSETVPGPFVFPIDTVLEFIKAKYAVGPAECHAALIDLSCCFVSSYSVGNSSIPAHYVNELLETFFANVSGLLEYEPETQTSNLKLLRQIFSHYLNVILENPQIEVMIHFALKMLTSTDRFAMREATFFWSSFIRVTGNDRQAFVLASIGPQLVDTLLSKIAGDSARSELEYFSEVIKALMAKQQLLSKPWFQHGLVDSPSPSLAKVDKNKRVMLLKQLGNLRGGRETTQVVKQFWLTARGITDYV